MKSSPKQRITPNCWKRAAGQTGILLALLSTMLLCAQAQIRNPWVSIDGKQGPGSGRHIVLVSGDEEYRSEEAMPMLAKILALHHGFNCTVLFAINPKTGEIDPNTVDNIPGLQELRSADLMIIFTRFRQLPDDQMKCIDDYLASGKPVIGIRPAVVAFRTQSQSPYYKYSADYRGTDYLNGFGQQVLGATWISHHGAHGSESTRGVIVEAQKEHPILRGVDSMWGPSDVYTVREPIPHGGSILVVGHVLAGMSSDSPPSNKPLMPLAWTKTYPSPKGNGRVFMTTLGASQDFRSEGLRRMLINACYWAVGLENKIPARSNANCVGPYEPTAFGFNAFRRGVFPSKLNLLIEKEMFFEDKNR